MARMVGRTHTKGCTCCDSNRAPRQKVKARRQFKRSEKARAKREIIQYL